jgi:hypothetical protein
MVKRWGGERRGNEGHPSNNILSLFFCLHVTDRLHSNSREIYTRVAQKESLAAQ